MGKSYFKTTPFLRWPSGTRTQRGWRPQKRKDRAEEIERQRRLPDRRSRRRTDRDYGDRA